MRQTMEQHKAEYRARPLSERLGEVFAEVADTVPNPAQVRAMANPQIAAIKVPSKAYKPTRNRLSDMTHDGAYLIVIPMACWHRAANDDYYPAPSNTA